MELEIIKLRKKAYKERAKRDLEIYREFECVDKEMDELIDDY